MRLKGETSSGGERRKRRKIELIIFFLWLAEEVLGTDGRTEEGTKFEVELFFFPTWKKVQDAAGVVIVAENKDFTSEFRGEVSLRRPEHHFRKAS